MDAHRVVDSATDVSRSHDVGVGPFRETVAGPGGGVRGGQTYGRTTYNGGYVEENPVSPADLAATIFHHLGIDHTQTYHDHFQNIPRHVSEGRPVTDLG